MTTHIHHPSRALPASLIATLLILMVGVVNAKDTERKKAEEEARKVMTKLTYKTVDYKGNKEFPLQLHIFNPEGHKAGDKRPVVVMFHGGSWDHGGPSSLYRSGLFFRSKGFVAISVQYRLIKVKMEGNRRVLISENTPKECVKDGKSALRYIRQNAQSLGIDSNKVIGLGCSAGGHIVAGAASLLGCNEEGEDATVSCRPNALVLLEPVLQNGPDGWGHALVKDYWAEISPMHNVGKHKTHPPTVIIGGKKDRVVESKVASSRYKAEVEKMGGKCEVILYQSGMGHGFTLKGEWFDKSHEDAMKFLKQVGWNE